MDMSNKSFGNEDGPLIVAVVCRNIRREDHETMSAHPPKNILACHEDFKLKDRDTIYMIFPRLPHLVPLSPLGVGQPPLQRIIAGAWILLLHTGIRIASR